MLIDKEFYNELVTDLKSRLDPLAHLMVLSIPTYKSFFNINGSWDKRKKYFSFTLKINKNSKKSNNILMDIGNILIKLGEYVEDNNNGKIYMITEFNSGGYNEFKIKLKFISYDHAAKILLSQ